MFQWTGWTHLIVIRQAWGGIESEHDQFLTNLRDTRVEQNIADDISLEGGIKSMGM